MEVTPGEIYRYFGYQFETTTTIDEQRKWQGHTINGPLSSELLAGLIVGISVVHGEMVKKENRDRKLDTIRVGYKLSRYLYDLKEYQIIDRYYKHKENYEITNPLPDLIMRLIKDNKEIDNLFFWWILDPKTDKYILYKFRSPEFIQGFISILKSFGLDFHQYVNGLPFKIKDNNQIFYEIKE